MNLLERRFSALRPVCFSLFPLQVDNKSALIFLHLTAYSVLAEEVTIHGSYLFLHYLVESARIENDGDIEKGIEIMFVNRKSWICLFWSVLFLFQMVRQIYHVPIPLDRK